MTKGRFRDLLQQDPQSGKGDGRFSLVTKYISRVGPHERGGNNAANENITHQWCVPGIIKLVQQKFLRLLQDCCDFLVVSIRDCVTQRRQTGQFRWQERVRVRKMNFGMFRQLSANGPGHLLPDIVDSKRGICQETRQFRERSCIATTETSVFHRHRRSNQPTVCNGLRNE